jgi:hypothetical protein
MYYLSNSRCSLSYYSLDSKYLILLVYSVFWSFSLEISISCIMVTLLVSSRVLSSCFLFILHFENFWSSILFRSSEFTSKFELPPFVEGDCFRGEREAARVGFVEAEIWVIRL